MESFLQISSSLEPLFLAATSLGVAVLALSVYRSNKKSATNIIFVFLSLSILLWLWSAYMAGIVELADTAIIFHRLAIFFAAPMSTLFFLLTHTMPKEKLTIKKHTLLLIVGLTLLMMAVNISPYAFIGTGSNGVRNPVAGPGIIPFGVISSIFSLLAVYFLFKKYLTSEKKEQVQFRTVLIGIFAMLVLVIGTILIPIVFFQSGVFLPFLSLYTIVFLGMTAYAITEYQLFNISVILTQAITVVIWITLFSKIFFAETLIEKSVDALIFLITVIFGISLIRSVRNEIQQRQKIQILAEDLETANERQEDLIHFITHEVKGYLTNAQAGFASIMEGDVGPVSPEMQTMVKGALASVRKGSETVKDILAAANLKKGTVAYVMQPFDFGATVKNVISQLKAGAEAKGLALETNIQEGDFTLIGDKEQIEQHVIRNLIDNSIKYTPQGKVTVGLEKKNNKLLFSVKDTGVGITNEDKQRLFTQGGKGKDSIKVNVDSTGYGLYIAKNIVEAHKGKIWAESEGAGKGSQFYAEFS